LTKRFQTPPQVHLADAAAERVRKGTDKAMRELQAVPIVAGKLVRDIELVDGVNTPVAHGLGARACVFLSPPQMSGSATTGRIREVRDPSFDPRKYVVFRASGWSETIIVDAWCFRAG
jgi:hypothetical protein